MRSLVVCVALPSGYEPSVRLAGLLAGHRYLRVNRPPAQVQVRGPGRPKAPQLRGSPDVALSD